MLSAKLFVSFALATSAASIQAASFDCVAPVFPAQHSGEGARRVEKQIKAWRKCHAAYRAGHDHVEVARMNAEVEASIDKWLATTRAYWSRQGASSPAASRGERESLHSHADNRTDRDEQRNSPR